MIAVARLIDNGGDVGAGMDAKRIKVGVAARDNETVKSTAVKGCFSVFPQSFDPRRTYR
jgi:hypothetical protein